MTDAPERAGAGADGVSPLLARGAASRQVSDYIRDLIFTGRLAANERINQDEIARVLGVSRLPVREALIALESEGMVTSKPHRGVYVVPIYAVDIEDQYAVYARIQGLAVARATPNIADSAIDKLDELNSRMALIPDGPDRRSLDWEFHSIINHAGGSARVMAILRQLGRNLPRTLYSMPPALNARAIVEHADILEALRKRDPELAEDRLIRHTTAEGTHLAHLLREKGVLADPADEDFTTAVGGSVANSSL